MTEADFVTWFGHYLEISENRQPDNKNWQLILTKFRKTTSPPIDSLSPPTIITPQVNPFVKEWPIPVQPYKHPDSWPQITD